MISQPETPSAADTELLNACLRRHGLALARLGPDGTVRETLGAPLAWLSVGAPAFETPALAGLKDDFAALRSGATTRLSMPAVSLMSGARFALAALWRADLACYEVLATPADGDSETETLLARERRVRQVAEEQAERARARADAEARVALVMRERLKIAHDLHDTIVHALVAVVAQLGLVRKIVDRAPERSIDEIARADAAARQGLAQARAALGQVRFERAGLDGLGAALARAAQRFEARTGVAVALSVAPHAAALAGERAEILYRIVEEALRNIETHANAAQVRLSAQTTDAHAIIEIADDGCGFDPNRRRDGHYGLVGMAEQAEMIGGRLEVETAPGAGARLIARAPLDPAAPDVVLKESVGVR